MNIVKWIIICSGFLCSRFMSSLATLISLPLRPPSPIISSCKEEMPLHAVSVSPGESLAC